MFNKDHLRMYSMDSSAKIADYSSLLEQSNECTFHVKKLHKTIADLNPNFMKEIFIKQDTP